nr:ATPase F0 subunit 8 [Notomastus sp. GK-2021]
MPQSAPIQWALALLLTALLFQSMMSKLWFNAFRPKFVPFTPRKIPSLTWPWNGN